MTGVWNRFSIVLVLLFALALPAMSQEKPKADDKPASVSAITEVESLRMRIAQLTDELVQAGEARRMAEKQRDQYRLQVVMIQASPVRDQALYDWSVGAFRHTKTGQVWDFEANQWKADDKTPKPVKAEDAPKTEKPGGGL